MVRLRREGGARSGKRNTATNANQANLTARVTANTVTYEICNQSGTNQNFGTSPPLRFLVLR